MSIEKSSDDSKREVGKGRNTIIEHFDGVLESGAHKYEATCHLWKIPNEDFVKLGSWGGTVTLAGKATTASAFELMFGRGNVTVSGIGRRAGEAIVTKTTNNQILIIKGSGTYPSKQ
ncbi:MAG: hypothetical protein CME31_21575 [Gimesia sp.]|uniref:Uncharacterized protein n=1 Tax=Gimesia maris TaxID=122 RepID=A0A3D3R033_9PLAN|nr:hypothetical protein [Gimesia sp.]HCO22211.1 hypothetical protein [Gimesia maris]|tara:strand:+ start:96840 stop:97190 length:351 start_codon:yes stop_codon:yes gene_type:complete